MPEGQADERGPRRLGAIGTQARRDERSITDARTIALNGDSAVLTYRWRSRRSDSSYAAVMSSVYARRDGVWRLVLHQQTPEPAAG